jgi:hypothetical protein
VAADLVGADGDDLKRLAGALIEQGGAPAFRFFTVAFPAEFTVREGVGGDVGAGKLVDLEDEEIAGEDGGGAEALDVVGGGDGDAPAEFAGGGVGEKAEVLEEDVDVFAVSDGGNGGGMVEAVDAVGTGGGFGAFPEEFAGGAVEALGVEILVGEAGEEDVFGWIYRGGGACARGGFCWGRIRLGSR